MRRPPDIRAFLAQHSDGRLVSQVPSILGIAANEAETGFRQELLSAGSSSSYFALLNMAATLAFDAGEYFPAADASRRDQGEWHGYYRGLQTALACLVMHETGCNPSQAALLVAKHTEALIRCRWSDRPAEGGR